MCMGVGVAVRLARTPTAVEPAIGHSDTGNSYIGHSYTGHNFAGHSYAGAAEPAIAAHP